MVFGCLFEEFLGFLGGLLFQFSLFFLCFFENVVLEVCFLSFIALFGGEGFGFVLSLGFFGGLFCFLLLFDRF